MSKYYTASYEGIAYNKTVKNWHKFLADKPVDKRITENCMRTRLKARVDNGQTLSQCLGIDKVATYNTKKDVMNVRKSQLKQYLLVNKWLRQRLVNNDFGIQGND